VNDIRNALTKPVQDPMSNHIHRSALEVRNTRNIHKKNSNSICLLNCVLLSENAASILSDRDMRHERVTDDVYCTTATSPGLDFGAGSSYAVRTSSAGATHDDVLDLGLDTTTDVLSQLEDAPDTTQRSQPLQGGRARQPPHRFTPSPDTVIQRKRNRHH
jgi:hypothetical protein